jgi:hypothetical protein
MEISNQIQFLFYTIPAIVVLAGCYFLIKKFLDNEQKIRLLEMKKEWQKDLLPLRMQAYERMVLFLERISPNNLLMRVHKPGFTAKEFQVELHSTIRHEFEHNITQQIYISSQAWIVAKGSKEEIIKLINTAASRVEPNSSAMDLSAAIFEIIIKNELKPAQNAIEFIKKEARTIFI